MNLHIQKTLAFVAHTLDAMRNQVPAVTYPCPHCKTPVNFPLVARGQDVEHFQTLIEIAEKYLEDNGVADKIFAEIRKQLAQGFRAQEVTNQIITKLRQEPRQ